MNTRRLLFNNASFWKNIELYLYCICTRLGGVAPEYTLGDWGGAIHYLVFICLWHVSLRPPQFHWFTISQGRQFVLKSGGDKRSDEKTLQQDGKNIE